MRIPSFSNSIPSPANALRAVLATSLMASLVVACCGTKLLAQDKAAAETPNGNAENVENPFPNRHAAPDLDGGIEWLNSAGPISLKDLRGKVVLLDFWTFCCINCMHILPDLAYLEKKYPNELVVIGVHSAKFDNEKESGNIRNAILRYEIAHPVINDAKMTLWRKFEVGSWPTLILLDPEGQYCGFVSGEGNREVLDKVIEKLIAYHKAKGTLDQTPVRFDLERNQAKPTPLRYPGKLLVDEKDKRLFISDSNHNRIVVCRLDGGLIDVIGSGAIGLKDGNFTEAEFDHPQGLVLVGETLYVADTENHLIRKIDLDRKAVETLAGTGEQNRTRSTGGKLRETALNSPWDLSIIDGVMYIAMAGPHQIWSHKLGSDAIQQFAGSGREDIIDGVQDQSAFAQPSGIANDGTELFVVDSEGSAIRKVVIDSQNDLEHPKAAISTIAGTHDLARGRSLFEFGDVNGTGEKARFQHPLGIVYRDHLLFVADSYNHRIRQIDLKSRKVTHWAGTGKPGTKLDPVQFNEPAGLAISGGKMYVADTNNHRIVVIDIKSKKAQELEIADLTAPKPLEEDSLPQVATPSEITEVERQELPAGNKIEVKIELSFPEGYKLNPLLPVTYRLKEEGQLLDAAVLTEKLEAKTDNTGAIITIPTKTNTGETQLLLSVTYGYCRDGAGGVCKIKTTHWKIPVTLKEDGNTAFIKLNVKAK